MYILTIKKKHINKKNTYDYEKKHILLNLKKIATKFIYVNKYYIVKRSITSYYQYCSRVKNIRCTTTLWRNPKKKRLSKNCINFNDHIIMYIHV